MRLEKTHLQLGYIPLLDCVALIWAQKKGYFAEQGLEVTLIKEVSWASLRDRLAFGLLDAAHCLSAILPAAALGTDQVGIPFTTPLILSQNSAYISLSQQLCYQLGITATDTAQQSSEKLTAYVRNNTIKLAHVYPHSLHHFCLKEWLALSDDQVAKQLPLQVLPPPYMVEAISNHLIDGFCAGEPWHSQGEIMGKSQIVVNCKHIAPPVADKVLAVTQEWAEKHPQTLIALTSAIIKAQQEIQSLTDDAELWSTLMEFNIIRFPCSADTHVPKYHQISHILHHFTAENLPPQAHDFVWLIQQSLKWGNSTVDETSIPAISHQLIQPDIYQQAMRRLNL